MLQWDQYHLRTIVGQGGMRIFLSIIYKELKNETLST